MNKTISFIIPTFNEEERIGKTFKALEELLLPRGLRLKEVIFVNDGSTDKTKKLIRAFISRHSEAKSRRISKRSFANAQDDNAQYTMISYTENRGKGYAIRRGMMEASGDYNLFFDADMSTPLTELHKFAPFINQGIDVIVGTRKNGKSAVIKHQPRYRELLGKGFTRITQLFLNIPVTDFTCGFKAFSLSAKNEIFPETHIDRWGYDAELLFLAFKQKHSVVEKSVIWANDERTKVNLVQAVPQTLLELVTIHRIHTLPGVVSTLSGILLRLFPKWDTIK